MQTYRRFLIPAVALAAAFSLVAPRPCAAQGPLRTDLGVLPGFDESIAWAINGSGQVVGASFSSDYKTAQGFVWQNGVMTALPYPQGSVNCAARDINASGQIVGGCTITETQLVQASLWQFVRGAWTVALLEIPAGYTQSVAITINDSGGVAGYVGITNPIPNPTDSGGVYWVLSGKKTVMTVLEDTQGRAIIPWKMNAAGQILGTVATTAGGEVRNEMVIWKAGAVTDVGMYNPSHVSMNNKGEVVGEAWEYLDGPIHESFLYLPADDYDMTQGTYISSDINYAINDNGVIAVVQVSAVDGSKNLSLLNLTNLTSTFIHQFPSSSKLEQSLVINASGAVAGNFNDRGWYSSFYAGVDAVGVAWYDPLSDSPNDAFAYDLNDSGSIAGYVRVPGKASAWAVTVTPAPLIILSAATSARKSGMLTETVSLKNTSSTSTADNVVVNTVALYPVLDSSETLGTPVFSSSTPVSLKSIRPGAAQTFDAKFTGSSVPPGTYKMEVKATCSLGAVEIMTASIAVN